MPRSHRLLPALGATLLFTAPAALDAQATLGVKPLTPFFDDWLSNPIVSPNGRFYLANRLGGTAVAYDVRRNVWTPLNETMGDQPRWSPNGRFVTLLKRNPQNSAQWHLWLTPIDTATGLPTGAARKISRRPARAPSWSPDGRRIVFSSGDGVNYEVVAVPFNGGDEEVLYSAKGSGGSTWWLPDGKAVVAGMADPARWIHVDLATKKATVTPIPPGPGIIAGVSPDGTRKAAFNTALRLLRLADPVTGRPLTEYSVPELVAPHLFTSTGDGFLGEQHVVPEHVQVVDVRTGIIRALTTPDTIRLRTLTISPDGRSLAYQKGSALHLLPTTGGSPRIVDGRMPNAGTWAQGALLWSADGRQILTCGTHELGLVDVGSGRWRSIVRLADAPRHNEPQCRFAKQGTVIHWTRATRGAERENEVREVTLNGKSRILARFVTRRVPNLLDDTLVTYAAEDGIMARHLVTGATKLLVPGRIWGSVARWSPDGTRLLVPLDEGDRMVPYLFDPRTQTGTRIPYALPGEISEVQFHPDGRHLVAYICTTCVEPNYLEKWDIALVPLNGEPVRVLTASQKQYRDHNPPKVSPDGSLIAFVGQPKYTTRFVNLTIPKR